MTQPQAALEPPSGAAPARAHAHVASKTPGRLRVRLHHARHDRELLNKIKTRIQAQHGTHDVHVDSRTGSVLVHFDPHTQTHAGLLSVLQDLGVIAAETARGLDLDVPEIDASGHSEASRGIIDAMDDLDRQLAVLTGHKVDLKILFPLALGGVGLWAATRRGLGLTEVPAYVLLWYAFDSFWKFHREPARATKRGSRNG